jgi:hypothetical protein
MGFPRLCIAGAMLLQHEHTLRSFKRPLLLLHCADDEGLPSPVPMTMYHWACGSEPGANPSEGLPGSATPSGERADSAYTTFYFQRQAEEGPVPRTLCLFAVGGHNYIWPMNWKQYTHVLGVFLGEEEENGGRTNLASGEWWTSRQSHQAESGERRRCAIL